MAHVECAVHRNRQKRNRKNSISQSIDCGVRKWLCVDQDKRAWIRIWFNKNAVAGTACLDNNKTIFFFGDNAMVTAAFYDLWVTEMYFGSAPDWIWIPWMPNKIICHPGFDDVFEYEKAKTKPIAAPTLESAMNFVQWKRVSLAESWKSC